MQLPVVLLVAMSLGVLGQQLKSKEPLVTLCGRKLALSHHLVCSQLERMNYDKRTISSNVLDYDKWTPEEEYLWTGRRDALNVRWGRNKRLVTGLADECCLKPCYREEIQNYC